MTLSVLISTIDSGIEKVADVLLPPRDDVDYVVSMQCTEQASLELISPSLHQRDDVTIVTMQGRGLSRNRNNAMTHAKGDICLIADDDNKYKNEYFDTILQTYAQHPEADIITFQAASIEDGSPLHPYPAPYVCSVEMTFRRGIPVRFNENFGLGSPLLCAGEEEVFMKDAADASLKILYIPKTIVMTPSATTGTRFLTNPQLQLTKGATFRYVYGTQSALWRTVKEAAWHLLHNGANPLPIIANMTRGIFLNLES